MGLSGEVKFHLMLQADFERLPDWQFIRTHPEVLDLTPLFADKKLACSGF